MFPRLSRTLAMFFLSLVLCGPAIANVCRSIEAELSGLSRGGGSSGERRAAQRASAEAHRIYAHMRSIGCDRQQFIFFGAPPPPECGALRGRIQQLNQQVVSSSGYQNDARRRQLMSMLISHNCRTSPEPTRRSGTLVAGQFDDDDDSGVDQPIDRRSAQSRVRSVGGKPVCVRLCDGYFFPLHLRGPNLDDDGDQACAALCPAAETRMYRMSSDIGGARDREGQNYTELPNAFRYRQSYNPSCVCRAPNQGAGSQAFLPLNPGERGASGFLEMNPALEETPVEDDAAALRGGEKPVEKTTSAFGKRPPPAPPQEPLITADRLVPVEEGATQETRGPNGVKRTVRVIAPELFRAP